MGAPALTEQQVVSVKSFGPIVVVSWHDAPTLAALDHAKREMARVFAAAGRKVHCLVVAGGKVSLPSRELGLELRKWLSAELSNQCETVCFAVESSGALASLMRTTIEAAAFLSRSRSGFIQFAKTGADGLQMLGKATKTNTDRAIAECRQLGLMK